MMLSHIALHNILFLDIETVSAQPEYDALSEQMKELWDHKAAFFIRSQNVQWSEGLAKTLYTEKAGIFAEFGKIIVISVGFIVNDKKQGYQLRVKSFVGETEKTILVRFAELLNRHFNNPEIHSICGHNIKEFDIPYLCRRMLINQVQIPSIINVTGKKPWETKHFLDTMVMWKFGDYKSFTSLKLLAQVLGIPSPKDDIDGSDVGRIYWEEKDIERIARYCEKDVVAVAQLVLRFAGKPLLREQEVMHIPSNLSDIET